MLSSTAAHVYEAGWHSRDTADQVSPLLIRPKAQKEIVMKPCGHIGHVGTCPHCQREQLARWQHQLAAVTPKRCQGGEES
jgi:hypothetical protein